MCGIVNVVFNNILTTFNLAACYLRAQSPEGLIKYYLAENNTSITWGLNEFCKLSSKYSNLWPYNIALTIEG
jgi:hypothetical protein